MSLDEAETQAVTWNQKKEYTDLKLIKVSPFYFLPT